MYVYEIVNIVNQKRYIGITNCIEERFKYHQQKYASRKEFDKVLYRAIRKHGIDNFIFNVLFSGLTIEEAKEKEISLIQELNTLSHDNGYNVTKGGDHRNNQGENNNTTILTTEQVLDIIKRRTLGEKGIDVYQDYQQITRSAFSNIWRGINWPHLQDKSTIEVVKGNAKLSAAQVREIKSLLAKNVQNKLIQEQFNISYRDLWRIKNGHTYSNITI